MGDRFVGKFGVHEVEVARTNVAKQVVIRVDGQELARESVALPHSWEKEKEFQGNDGKTHKLVAHSLLKKMWGILPYDNEYSVDIDGSPVKLDHAG